jgi:hypothetical protein
MFPTLLAFRLRPVYYSGFQLHINLFVKINKQTAIRIQLVLFEKNYIF